MSADAQTQTRNLVAVSDLHVGDQMGLCPPDGVRLDGGGHYRPNEIQRKMWSLWESFWNDWVPHVTHGEPFDVCVNGDLIDGRKHLGGQFTLSLADMRHIAAEVLLPVANRCGRLFVTRGTPAHAGQESEDEESVAEHLGAVASTAGQYARPELWIRVGDALVHLLHHIGTAGVSSYETTAVHRELVEEFNEAARWSEEPPQFVIRSHRHRFARTQIDGVKGDKHVMFTAAVTPGWQAKTSFAFKIAGARIAPPQFGGLVIRQGDEEAYLRAQVWHMKRSEVE